MHGVQRCCAKLINEVDELTPQKYSARIMRVANVWMSFGHHKKIENVVRSQFGDAAAKAHCRTCIGNVVKSRWSTFEAPERKLLRGLLGFTPALPLRDAGNADDDGSAQMCVGLGGSFLELLGRK